jgi:hypothetical protein
MAARANTKLTESLMSVRNRIAKKHQQQALNVEQQVTEDTSSSTTTQTESTSQVVVQPTVVQPTATQVSTSTTTVPLVATAVPLTSATQANGYNLVEKKKRKVRCGKEAGPQDQFMFHLKLEHETKKKRKNTRRKAAKPEEPQQQQPLHQQIRSPPQQQQQQSAPVVPRGTTASITMNQPLSAAPIVSVTSHPQQLTPMNGVISSIVDAIAQDNNVVPTIVTMVDGCVLKANNALNKLLASSNGLPTPQRTMVHNILHPEDMSIHHIQLLKLLASNSDTSKYEIRMVNVDCRAIKVTMEVVCIRNDNALPQWLVIRVLSAMETNEFVRPELINQQQCSCQNHRQQDITPLPELTLDEMYLGELESKLFNGPPAVFMDNTGSISWNNSSFDQMFGISGRPFIGKNILEVSEMKGTPIELLSRAVLADQQEKWEAHISPTNIPSLGSKALKFMIQRISNTTDGTHGYLWLFSIVEEQARSESEQLTFKLMNECIDSQRKLQQEYVMSQQQQQQLPAHPTTTERVDIEMGQQESSSPINFLMMNDINCVNDEITRDVLFGSSTPSDKRFDYIDSNIAMYAPQQDSMSGWSNYDIPDQFFTDDVSETEIDSLFSSL